MKFGKSQVGMPVYYDGFDEDENEIIVFGYLKGVHSYEDGVILVKVNTSSSHDMIVNLSRLKSAKGVF